jgi:hypothetical protein
MIPRKIHRTCFIKCARAQSRLITSCSHSSRVLTDLPSRALTDLPSRVLTDLVVFLQTRNEKSGILLILDCGQ